MGTLIRKTIMAALRSSLKLSRIIGRKCIQQRYISSSSALRYEWNYKWEPRPYPKTKEEREAAAKFYEMIPEDYKPYPDDGTGWGDYPDLEPYRQAEKAPNETYDDPFMMTNYGEPLHIYQEDYSGDKMNAPEDMPSVSTSKMMAAYLTLVFGFLYYAYRSLGSSSKLGGQGGTIWMCNKQLPYDVLPESKFGRPGSQMRRTHYTFEPAQD